MSTRTALDRVLAFEPKSSVLGWALVALSIHVGLGVAMSRRAQAAPVELPPVEVEVAAPEPPKVEEPPPPEPRPDREAEPQVAAPHPHVAAHPAAPAAKAAPLLTAKDDAPHPSAEEPVSFVTDPNGSSYGYGVVAKGGNAEVGTGAATKPQPTAHETKANASPIAAPVPATNLSRKPSFAGGDPCQGRFPSGADDDRGEVSVLVTVKPDGSIASASVASETPAGQGFGAAARSCLLATKLVPALDANGNPALATTTIKVRFRR